MKVEIKPSLASGEVFAPPSKSVAHRLLICAALAEGESRISNIAFNDDINATVDCLRRLGAGIKVSGNEVIVKGISRASRLDFAELFCNESGSTLRFMLPVSLLFSKSTAFTCKARLLERPQSVYEDIFNNENCSFSKKENVFLLNGKLKNGIFCLPGNVSSQFITGLLLTLPLLEGNSEIILTSPLESAPYINITLDVLSQFGIVIDRRADGYFIKGNQKYTSRNLICEGDWSNAAFLEAFNLIDGNVSVCGLSEKSFQGDMIYHRFYEMLSVGAPELDITDCPDLAPILISCASLLNGCVLRGTRRLKIKESDRGEAMRKELAKLGADIVVNDDDIVVHKSTLKPCNEVLDCHNDHRIAMSLAIVLSVIGGVLNGAQCVNKSYPDFFNDIKALGINCRLI